MAKRKSTAASKRAAATAGTDPVAAKDAPTTTEESDKQVADTQAKALDEAHGETPVIDQALEQGFLGTVPEAGIQAAEYADLSNDAGYMGGPPKGEIVSE